MQSSTHRGDNSYISLGERRGKSDLARFSLDLSWARAVSDSSRSRAYPSPPMSGSPPLPPRRNLDASDRGHGSYGSTGQEAFRGPQTSQSEQIERSRGPPIRGFQEPQHIPLGSYTPYRMEEMSSQVEYQQQRPLIPPQQQHSYGPQPAAPFSTPGGPPMGDVSEYSSPKAQRKTKGHVASACVPCKRAHLRCDAQRPCSRCLSNGKEDACVDVQHKKRGRPRLRDEREPRYEGMGSNYPPPESLRRPLSLYAPTETVVATPFGDSLQRSSSYRVLKSQGGGGPLAPRYMEHQSPADPNVYGGSVPPTPRMIQTQEPICSFLTMEMQIVKATQGFGGTVGVHSVISRKFHDIVSASDRDKVFRLQRVFEEERREREPNYLPPIYLNKYDEDRVIESVDFGPEELNQVRMERQEMITFQAPDGQQRTFQIRFGLAKKDSTYFIVALINLPATPQSYHQPSSSPFSREPYSRDSQYGYQAQPAYQQNPAAPPFMSNTPFGDLQGNVPTYRTPGPLGSNIPQAANMPPFAQAPPRPEYSQGHNPYQTPRSEMQHAPPQQQPQVQAQAQAQHQRDLQLPPIRDQRGESSAGRRDDRGRFDIGGLLENPDLAGRGR